MRAPPPRQERAFRHRGGVVWRTDIDIMRRCLPFATAAQLAHLDRKAWEGAFGAEIRLERAAAADFARAQLDRSLTGQAPQQHEADLLSDVAGEAQEYMRARARDLSISLFS